MWEFYKNDELWAVRRAQNDSEELFHVSTREEAIALSATLNGYELGIGAAWNVGKTN